MDKKTKSIVTLSAIVTSLGTALGVASSDLQAATADGSAKKTPSAIQDKVRPEVMQNKMGLKAVQHKVGPDVTQIKRQPDAIQTKGLPSAVQMKIDH